MSARACLLWAKLRDPPWSMLVGVFATREAAEAAGPDDEELGAGRHYLRPDVLFSRHVQELPLLGAADRSGLEGASSSGRESSMTRDPTDRRPTERQAALLRLMANDGGPPLEGAHTPSDVVMLRALGMNPRRPGALSRVYNGLTARGLVAWRNGQPYLTDAGRAEAAR